MVTKQRSADLFVSEETIEPVLKGQKSALSLAVAAAVTGAVAMPATAVAQEEGDEYIEEIVTVGIRTSILDSVNAKRLGDTVSDVVDAGILGYLPDPSIADALGRLPGVTTIRDSGQSSQLNIRGMNGDFIQTTLNGREQASTAGYSEGTRWMSFDQYPAEMITQAAVYKSPKASQIEGGVAGIVDLKTVDPLAAPKPHNFALNARLSYNDKADDFGGDETGYRLNLGYQGKFLDDTLGIAAGVSYLEQPNAFIFSRNGADSQLGFASDRDLNGDGVDDPRSRAFQWQAGTGTEERIGALTSIVWEPNDFFRGQFDFFRTEFDRGDERQGVTVGGLLEGGSDTSVNVSNATVAGGLVTGATVSAVNSASADQAHPWFEARTEDQSTEADADTYGINLQFYQTDTTTVTFDAYISEGDKTRRDRIVSMHSYEFTTDAGTGEELWQETPGQTLTYQLNGQGIPTASFGGIDMADPGQMYLSRYEEYPHTYTDELEAFKLDLQQEVDWGFISGVEAGVRITERDFGADRGTFLYGSRSGQFRTDPTADGWCEDNTSSIACRPQSVDGFVSVQSLPGVPDHLVITDLDGLANGIFGAGNYQGIKLHSRDWTFIESNVITEETDAIYLMFNLDFSLGNVPVRGNFGVRYVETDVKSQGLQNVGAGNGTPITDGVGVTQDNLDFVSYGPDYSDTLPSLNLAFELSDKDIVRFAAASVMGRPPVGQLKGGAGSWFSGPGNSEYNVWTNGSPYLDPFQADQLDLSYEHYFDNGGAFTAAVFWKDIESLVEGPTQFAPGTVDFEEDLGITLPPGTTEGIYQTFLNNDKGGYIRGLELAGTYTFDTLPGIWGGLGASASYSYTESETEVGGGALYGQNLPLPGLSDNVFSATLFWDIGGFSAHINTRYRDDFVQNLPIPGANSPVRAQSYQTVDAQASYLFNNGLSVVISGMNLTDEENVIEYGVDGAFGEYKTFGRQVYFGVNYNY